MDKVEVTLLLRVIRKHKVVFTCDKARKDGCWDYYAARFA